MGVVVSGRRGLGGRQPPFRGRTTNPEMPRGTGGKAAGGAVPSGAVSGASRQLPARCGPGGAADGDGQGARRGWWPQRPSETRGRGTVFRAGERAHLPGRRNNTRGGPEAGAGRGSSKGPMCCSWTERAARGFYSSKKWEGGESCQRGDGIRLKC